MGQVLTILFLMAVCAVFLIRFVRANGRAKREREQSRIEKIKREEREQELLERLERIKRDRSDLERTKKVIQDDPKRAAKVLSKMMKK